MANVERFGRRRVVAMPAARRRDKGRWTTLWLMLLAFGVTAGVASLVLSGLPLQLPSLAPAPAISTPGVAAQFPICGGGRRVTCVVDGDTFWLDGLKYRIADIDTPEVSNFGCASEKALGDRATVRLAALLNAGPFALEPYERDEDRFGRKLRIVTRDGASLGAQLVREGLAHTWGGPDREWC